MNGVRILSVARVPTGLPDGSGEFAPAVHALGRGCEFLRHTGRNVDEEGGIRREDAVYSVTPDLPKRRQAMAATEAARDCAAQGIPTV